MRAGDSLAVEDLLLGPVLVAVLQEKEEGYKNAVVFVVTLGNHRAVEWSTKRSLDTHTQQGFFEGVNKR